LAVNEKNILNRLYFIAGCMFIFGLAVVFKLLSIQFLQGDVYRAKAIERVVKNVVIPANRGNVYSVNGNLLATSIPKYDIRIDALTPSLKTFEKYIKPLCDSLSKYSGKSSNKLEKEIRRARVNRNRYHLLARDIGYSDYLRLRSFPMLNLGAFKGGLIVEQTTKREHPMGGIAQRTIESHEPGSTFKVMALMAALEDKVIDTSTVVDTKRGRKRFYGRYINDSHRGGYGEISAARAMEVSSNIGLATIIDEHYSEKPEKFLDRIKLVKPRFLKQIKEFDKEIEVFDKEVLVKKICSDETLNKTKEILKNIVVRGTGKKLYSETFSMAGKTGTARTEYWMKDWEDNPRYISSFSGYFPVENPKYSCIVVIHKPSTEVGFYGADVSGPVFKRVAQKIYTDTPLIDEIESLEVQVGASCLI